MKTSQIIIGVAVGTTLAGLVLVPVAAWIVAKVRGAVPAIGEQ